MLHLLLLWEGALANQNATRHGEDIAKELGVQEGMFMK